MSLPDKIGRVEELVLVLANEFADVEASELAGWINGGHAAIKMAVRRLAVHVAQVGAFLVAAKNKCEHGEWLDWLEVNCPEITVKTVQRYMALYEKGKSKTTLLSHLTPVQAYRHLGIVKDPTGRILARLPMENRIFS